MQLLIGVILLTATAAIAGINDVAIVAVIYNIQLNGN